MYIRENFYYQYTCEIGKKCIYYVSRVRPWGFREVGIHICSPGCHSLPAPGESDPYSFCFHTDQLHIRQYRLHRSCLFLIQFKVTLSVEAI